MAEFKISVGLEGIEAARAMVLGAAMPHLSKAVGAVAEQVQSNWMQAVEDAKLWTGEKKPYRGSIQWQMTGSLTAEVWSDYKYAEEIETGRPAKDLKRMLDTSDRVRRTKDGRRFLIIPFEHKVKDMPKHVYKEAKQLAPSKIIGTSQRRSGEITTSVFGMGMVPLGQKRQRRQPYLSNPASHSPVMVPRNIYQWGDRLAGGAMGPNARGKSDRFAGMVRFDTSTEKSKRSGYLTFRIMMEGSNGWVVPAKPGLYLARDVATAMQPKAEGAFAEAIKRDLV